MERKPPAGAPIKPWLRAALAFLIAADLILALLGLASIPGYVQRATDGTIEAYQVGVNSGVSNEIIAEQAAARGMSPRDYAVYDSIISVLFTVLVGAVGLLTLARARLHWFGWLSAHIMLFLASWSLYTPMQVARLVPMVWIELSAVLWPLFILYFFLFPDGRAVPRWGRWPVALYLPIHFVGQLLGVLITAYPRLADVIDLPAVLGALQALIFVIFPFLLGCQVYRYVRVSPASQRLQTKWFIYGFALFFGLSGITELIWGSGKVPLELTYLPMAFLPLSLGVAILRYRLWDIDVVIRRTLVYGLLTALLAFVFFGSVILLQSVFTSLTGQESPAALVGSTLAIAALFTPLRNRVQRFVDRRFYRRKYDAQQVLAHFATTARDETEIEELSSALVFAVRDTMQPATTGVWIKGLGGKR